MLDFTGQFTFDFCILLLFFFPSSSMCYGEDGRLFIVTQITAYFQFSNEINVKSIRLLDHYVN